MAEVKTNTAGAAKPKKPSKVGEAIRKARQSAAETKAAMDAAYDKGFADGYSAAQELPKKTGVKTLATAGYSAGQKEYARRQKADERIRRGQAQSKAKARSGAARKSTGGKKR